MASRPQIKGEQRKERPFHFATCWPKLFLRRPRTECEICCENKLNKDFTHHKRLPFGCRGHLQNTCQSCVRTSLSAQLDSKPLLAVGCPQCAASWSNEVLRMTLGRRERKRFQVLDLLAQGRAFIPAPQDMPEASTLDVLLESGARLCPWCGFPFYKAGGCDHMSCSKCNKSFALQYAPVLEDGKGRRARHVSDEMELEFW